MNSTHHSILPKITGLREGPSHQTGINFASSLIHTKAVCSITEPNNEDSKRSMEENSIDSHIRNISLTTDFSFAKENEGKKITHKHSSSSSIVLKNN
jgi:hypothetical protein